MIAHGASAYSSSHYYLAYRWAAVAVKAQRGLLLFAVSVLFTREPFMLQACLLGRAPSYSSKRSPTPRSGEASPRILAIGSACETGVAGHGGCSVDRLRAGSEGASVRVVTDPEPVWGYVVCSVSLVTWGLDDVYRLEGSDGERWSEGFWAGGMWVH